MDRSSYRYVWMHLKILLPSDRGGPGQWRWIRTPGSSRKRHFVCLSWLEPRFLIHLHCPDPPRLTVIKCKTADVKVYFPVYLAITESKGRPKFYFSKNKYVYVFSFKNWIGITLCFFCGIIKTKCILRLTTICKCTFSFLAEGSSLAIASWRKILKLKTRWPLESKFQGLQNGTNRDFLSFLV